MMICGSTWVGKLGAGGAYCDLQAAGKMPLSGANSAFVCTESIDAAAGAAADTVQNGYFMTTGYVAIGNDPPDSHTTFTTAQRPMFLSYGMCAKIRNIDYDYKGTGLPASRYKGNGIQRFADLLPSSTAVLVAEKRVNANELPATDVNVWQSTYAQCGGSDALRKRGTTAAEILRSRMGMWNGSAMPR